MKLRFTKDVGVDTFLHTGEATEQSFRRWQEIAVKDLIEIDAYHYDIVLPNDDVFVSVKKECFEVLDKI